MTNVSCEAAPPVRSRFEVLDSIAFTPESFSEPHIGIAAKLTNDGLEADDEIVRYWEQLGAPLGAIWQPGTKMQGSEIISTIVGKAAELYGKGKHLMSAVPAGIFGEVISFDGVDDIRGNFHKYDDRLPHVDFVPAESPCAVLFASNTGGTAAWSGEYEFKGNLEPSYADATSRMSKIVTFANQILYSGDAQTFLHARDEAVTNQDRVLFRVFIGHK